MKWSLLYRGRNPQSKSRGRRSKKAQPRRRKGLPLYLELLEQRLAPAVVTWNGQGDGVSWSDPHNWSGNALPGSADDVVINATPATTVQYSTGTTSIHSLQDNGKLQVTGGALTVTQNFA